MKVSFSPPDITEKEINMAAEALRSGWITTGPKTKEFEKEIAQYCGTKRAVCLNSATACMEMTLRLFEIGPGDEVIVPAYTYTATASVVNHVGAGIIMADSEENSFEMNYDRLAECITERTKAVIPVDLAGRMCDYDRIFQIINEKKGLFSPKGKMQKALGRILVLADAAHAFGARRKGVKCGNAADFTSFSFHAVKNLTTAEGGAVTWRPVPGVDDEWIYEQYMLLSLHGQSKDAMAKMKPGAWEYDIVTPAYKCNMTDIMASIGLAQLKRYKGMLARRREIITYYNAALKGLPVILPQHYDEMYSSSGHLYLMRIPAFDNGQRNEFIIRMAEREIAVNVHYKPLPMHTAYKNLGFDIKDFPNAYKLFANEVTLPLNTCLTDEQTEYVTENVIEIIGKMTGK